MNREQRIDQWLKEHSTILKSRAHKTRRKISFYDEKKFLENTAGFDENGSFTYRDIIPFVCDKKTHKMSYKKALVYLSQIPSTTTLELSGVDNHIATGLLFAMPQIKGRYSHFESGREDEISAGDVIVSVDYVKLDDNMSLTSFTVYTAIRAFSYFYGNAPGGGPAL